MGNLIVVDDEYKSLAAAYREFGTKLDDAYSHYCAILATVVQSAVPSGTIHDNLAAFAVQADALRNQVTEILNPLARDCEAFVSNVDTADQSLY